MRASTALLFLLHQLPRACSLEYRYRSYGEIVDVFQGLQMQYPGLVEMYSAQERYQLPSPGDCTDSAGQPVPCQQWIVRITNEATLPEPSRPEVFFSGCLHGNERIGPPTLTVSVRLWMPNKPRNSTQPL
jgi:hypothetical protein